jgi:hypothetical protein
VAVLAERSFLRHCTIALRLGRAVLMDCSIVEVSQSLMESVRTWFTENGTSVPNLEAVAIVLDRFAHLTSLRLLRPDEPAVRPWLGFWSAGPSFADRYENHAHRVEDMAPNWRASALVVTVSSRSSPTLHPSGGFHQTAGRPVPSPISGPPVLHR